jgi:ABC-type antimicrobial peptide transport system permease subunit
VKDFNNNGHRLAIEPLIILYSPQSTWRIFAKIEGDRNAALAHIKNVQEKFDPGYPFEFNVLDEEFNKEYRTEAVIGKLSKSFTLVAVLISCLGLLGLASFTAARRRKELGIRKVLGATATNLIVMLCGDFTRLVVLGLILGMPVAWYIGSQYLNGYAYHTDLSSLMFLLTALAVTAIAMVTVGYQSAKAALSSPVDSLRNE